MMVFAFFAPTSKADAGYGRATVTLGSPNSGRGPDRAISPSIWIRWFHLTHDHHAFLTLASHAGAGDGCGRQPQNLLEHLPWDDYLLYRNQNQRNDADDCDQAHPVLQGEDNRIVVHGPSMSHHNGPCEPVQQDRADQP